MHDLMNGFGYSFASNEGYKTVNGKRSCTTGLKESKQDTDLGQEGYKTVNGKRSCTTRLAPLTDNALSKIVTKP